MTDLVQYGLARVKAILHAPETYDGWRMNKRPPQVGDVGTITDILRAPEVSDHFIVEMSDRGTGATIWLSDFDREELEPVTEGFANQTIHAIGVSGSRGIRVRPRT